MTLPPAKHCPSPSKEGLKTRNRNIGPLTRSARAKTKVLFKAVAQEVLLLIPNQNQNLNQLSRPENLEAESETQAKLLGACEAGA